jgi:hypothetical protein
VVLLVAAVVLVGVEVGSSMRWALRCAVSRLLVEEVEVVFVLAERSVLAVKKVETA